MNSHRRQAMNAARAALEVVAAHDKGAIPPPNDRDPRRVSAHLGEFVVEAEFPPRRADYAVMIEHRGELALKAHVVPTWKKAKRIDAVEITDLHGEAWFAEFLSLAPDPPAPPPAKRKRPRKAVRKAGAKAKRPARAKAAAKPRQQSKRRAAPKKRTRTAAASKSKARTRR